ncbi:AzlD family protein [Roseibium sp.]|uniref:AzlD family protein n=1 Tax=Roseibium sp. TaxID=1936156 RepID=UPI003A96E548
MIENSFSADGLFVAAVLSMTLVTYTMRAGGYWVMGRVPLTPRVRRALESLPGAIIVSTILPIALEGGLPVAVCLVVSGAVMALVRKDIVAVFCAVVAAAAIRAYGF